MELHNILTPDPSKRDSVLITLPIHNEAVRLEQNVEKLLTFVEEENLNSVVLLAEDGSTDMSAMVCRQLSEKYPQILSIHSDEKLGRGRALREAWHKFRTPPYRYYVFMDADLATNLSCLKELFAELRAGNDVVVGSRYLDSSITLRPKLRLAMSLAYNHIVRLLFKGPIRDYQCGFKGFGRRAIQFLLPVTKEDSWFWDTEICVLGIKMGFTVREIPVIWREKKNSKTPLKRLVQDILLHGTGLVRLLLRIKRLRKKITIS